MTRVKSIDKIDIPNGIYSAIRYDDEVTINVYGRNIVTRLESGEKATGHTCTVELVNGIVYINENG